MLQNSPSLYGQLDQQDYKIISQDNLNIFPLVGKKIPCSCVKISYIFFMEILELVKSSFMLQIFIMCLLSDRYLVRLQYIKCTRHTFFPQWDCWLLCGSLHQKCAWYSCLSTIPSLKFPLGRMSVFIGLPCIIAMYIVNVELLVPSLALQDVSVWLMWWHHDSNLDLMNE